VLNAVIRLALRYRPLVVVLSLAVLVSGGYVAAHLPIDVFPDLDRPRVVVITEAAGLAPEEVETLVTFPLEAALLGTSGVQDVRSQSGLGLSAINVEFDWGTDVRVARQTVQERLTTAQGTLPAGVAPQMAPISSIMGQIVMVAITSDRASPMEVREAADFVIRPRLLAIPGVAQVIPIGGEVRQYRVSPHPAAIRALGITYEQVEKALAQFGTNAGGGFTDLYAREYLIRNVGGTASLDDLRNLVVATP